MCKRYLYFVTVSLIVISCKCDDALIRDYFKYKNIRSIIGFSCGNAESDIKLMRLFSDTYTLSSLWNFESVISKHINLRTLLKANYRRIGIFIDSRCNNTNYTAILSEATKYLMFDEMHQWLILTTTLEHGIQLLDDRSFSVVTDVVIATSSNKSYVLYDVYNPSKNHGGSINITFLGTWREDSGLHIVLTQSKFYRRSNLHGMHFRVGVLVGFKSQKTPLSEFLLDHSVKSKHGRAKFLYTILLHLSDLFNFTINLVEITAKKKYDNRGPIFTAFQENRIDLSTSPLVMRTDRLSYGDIVAPVWPIRSCFMFRTISSTTMKTAQFLRPLSPKVWYSILILIGLAVSALIILLRLEGIHSVTESCGISVLVTIGALSQQGSAFVPIHYAGRIAFLQIMLFSLLILNYYSASVVSDRLKNTGTKMNDSLVSLAKSNLMIAVEPTEYIHSLLQSTDPQVQYFYRTRWQKIPEANRYLPLEEGLKRVSKGGFAYHTMTDSAYLYIGDSFEDRMICELTEVHLFKAVLALWAKYKSPFTEILRVGMAKIHNVGIKRRQWKRWSPRKPFCPKNLLVAEPLSIHEAAPVLMFLSFCTVLSLVICVIENFVFWIWPTRSKILESEKRRLLRMDTNSSISS